MTRSTRDLEDARRRLERWLADELPDGAAPSVSALTAPGANGMSSETLLFDATWEENGGRRSEALVARIAPEPSAVPVFPHYDLQRQFDVMRLVRAHSDVPVPQVFWVEPHGSAVGSPCFVMERIDGLVPPDVMPYPFGDNWLSDASHDEQLLLQESSVALLTSLHGIDEAEKRFGFLASSATGDSTLRRHVADQWAYYNWAAQGLRSPLIERCFAWLDENWPQHPGPTRLSWGDARIGNVMYRNFRPVAVLDWEMAGLGPPEIDLAWFIFLHRFFEDLCAQYGLAGMPHFLRRADVASTYEALSGYTPRDLDWFTMYAALRHGIVMHRVQQRTIHFGEATMPEDPDDLILHRATLEAMLAGTYAPAGA